MNKKKRNVIDKAHELFIEQGYHATSIQDILDHSGISKGSFYNYFSSKSELFKAVFNLILENMQIERDKLLIGEEVSDINIFKEQISFIMKLNKKNKLNQLIDDVLVSSDPDLIKFIKQFKLLFLHWVYERFLDIFPRDKEIYLMDCAVIFTGVVQNILYMSHTLKTTFKMKEIVNYSMDRVITILEDISTKGVHLFESEKLNTLLPQSDYNDFFNNEFSFSTLNLKKVIEKGLVIEGKRMTTYLNLLYFIQEEIMNNKEPRKFLIESALSTLKRTEELSNLKEFLQYEQILANMKYYPIS
ncbi:TetR/AcrR family transcriptional regulator [Psychrobacillus glaciei]|uniref:TetR/AcrR family transcriptional regulator n=1 Tax=Psychrobacillus glaciei TaxID=2283160 RepID=A0A5J6SS59_9BACI|nr:TetR/AcrR family transcriptional regulator [Psychrobacillus glaciei]QFG00701.1 TetR/AcrR family transcriptional regulator [Psychrobacillus glaciei]